MSAEIAEMAWQLNQRFLHADYLGDEPDTFQLRRDLAELALLVHQLADVDSQDERAAPGRVGATRLGKR